MPCVDALGAVRFVLRESGLPALPDTMGASRPGRFRRAGRCSSLRGAPSCPCKARPGRKTDAATSAFHRSRGSRVAAASRISFVRTGMNAASITKRCGASCPAFSGLTSGARNPAAVALITPSNACGSKSLRAPPNMTPKSRASSSPRDAVRLNTVTCAPARRTPHAIALAAPPAPSSAMRRPSSDVTSSSARTAPRSPCCSR